VADVERAAWLIRRTALLVTLGDTTQAVTLARQALRRYPSISVTVQAISALERIAAARGDSLDPEDQRMAAEVDYFRLDRASAMRRLASAFAGGAERIAGASPAPGRSRAPGEAFPGRARRARQRRRAAPDAEARGRCALERGRCFATPGTPRRRSGRSLWRDSGVEPASRERRCGSAHARGGAAALEAGAKALHAGDRIRAAPCGRGRIAAGVLWYREGRHDRARTSWMRGESEALRFWRAIAQRTAHADSSRGALESIAACPATLLSCGRARLARNSCRSRAARFGRAGHDRFVDTEALRVAATW